eukprot:2532356-Rhodomonas_salina.1
MSLQDKVMKPDRCLLRQTDVQTDDWARLILRLRKNQTKVLHKRGAMKTSASEGEGEGRCRRSAPRLRTEGGKGRRST